MIRAIRKSKTLCAGLAGLLLISGVSTWGFLSRGPVHRGNVESLCTATQPGMSELDVVALLGGPANEDIESDLMFCLDPVDVPGTIPLDFTRGEIIKAWGDTDCAIFVFFNDRGQVAQRAGFVRQNRWVRWWTRARNPLGLTEADVVSNRAALATVKPMRNDLGAEHPFAVVLENVISELESAQSLADLVREE